MLDAYESIVAEHLVVDRADVSQLTQNSTETGQVDSVSLWGKSSTDVVAFVLGAPFPVWPSLASQHQVLSTCFSAPGRDCVHVCVCMCVHMHGRVGVECVWGVWGRCVWESGSKAFREIGESQGINFKKNMILWCLQKL